MNRYKLTVEYSGEDFSGMQRQNSHSTVQSVLEVAISSFFNEDIKINFAGRTDAGVHALGQVVDFISEKNRDVGRIVLGVNFFLKGKRVVCLFAEKVDMTFNSRFSAKERHYVYKIINRNAPLTFLSGTHLLVRERIDINTLVEAGQCFVGRHDFSLFRNVNCQARSPIKTINRVHVEEVCLPVSGGREVYIFFSAKSFLYNMVRKMVGVMLDVATGKVEIAEVYKMLENNSTHVAKTVKPNGLYLLGVDY